MYRAFLNWQLDRNFEYGFSQAEKARQGVVAAPWYKEVLKALARCVKPTLLTVVAGILGEFLRRLLF